VRGLNYNNERVDALFDHERATMGIHATRDRLVWATRRDQWMPLQDASIT
jgi:hypothetical protein